MEDSPLVNTHSIIHKNQISTLTVEAPTIAPTESSLSSASSNSSALSSSSSSNDEQHLKESYQNLYNCNNCDNTTNRTTSNETNLIESLLIKKSPTIDNVKGYMSSSTSSNSITTTTTTMLPKSNSNHNHLGFGNNNNNEIESAAKKYRCAAQISEATCSWKGKLPPKSYRTPVVYSTKVFVGGLPWDITEEDLVKEFGQFGPCRVEWTNKEKFNLLSNGVNVNSSSSSNQFRNYRSVGNLNQQQQQQQQQQINSKDSLNSSKQRSSPGFAYVIYDNEFSVRSLVNNCIEDYANGRDRVEFYFKISTRRVRNKEVQIIPWILADNNFALCTPKELDPKKTVFVGNLHGTMTARDLAHIMNELFGSVVYAGIDIDKLKYPIGSGRVTFANQQNFMRAVRAAFVDIQTAKFSKRIQIDPYLEDVQCCICYNEKGVYFCRDFQCFNYYCGSCWSKQHSIDVLGNHKPLMRKREEKL
jgi:cytoplasmic polyadenylation element-binding protein